VRACGSVPAGAGLRFSELGRRWRTRLEALLIGDAGWQVNLDLGVQFDDAGGDFDQAQSQHVELHDAPGGAPRHGLAQRLQQPIRAGMQEQPELIGFGLVAGGPRSADCRCCFKAAISYKPISNTCSYRRRRREGGIAERIAGADATLYSLYGERLRFGPPENGARAGRSHPRHSAPLRAASAISLCVSALRKNASRSRNALHEPLRTNPRGHFAVRPHRTAARSGRACRGPSFTDSHLARFEPVAPRALARSGSAHYAETGSIRPSGQRAQSSPWCCSPASARPAARRRRCA
jgi:hypothetical protein